MDSTPVKATFQSPLKAKFPDLEAEEFSELASAYGSAPPPTPTNLTDEILTSMQLSPERGQEIVAVICGALASTLASGKTINIVGFGQFRVRTYRPAEPARIGSHSFVEAPYLGPIEFEASATLTRYLDDREPNPNVVIRCDPLFATLREDRRMPRGKIPQLIRATFNRFSDVLAIHHFVELPMVGLLVVRPRPFKLKIRRDSQTVESLQKLHTVLLRPARALIRLLPGLVVVQEPHRQEIGPPVLEEDVLEDFNHDGHSAITPQPEGPDIQKPMVSGR